MTAKPRSRHAPRPAVAPSTASATRYQSHAVPLAPFELPDLASCLERHGRPDRPDAWDSVRCVIAVSAPSASRRHSACRGRRTWLEHEHHERPLLAHELRKSHAPYAELRAFRAKKMRTRLGPPVPDVGAITGIEYRLRTGSGRNVSLPRSCCPQALTALVRLAPSPVTIVG
jgi:hypothetical protein